MPPLEDRAALTPSLRSLLEEVVRAHETLEDLLRWGAAQTPPVLIEEVVTQDEYTHDVLVPWGNEGLHLVYDTS